VLGPLDEKGVKRLWQPSYTFDQECLVRGFELALEEMK